MPILKRNGKTFSGTPTKVDTAKSYTTFDSADDKNPTTWSDVELLTSKEEQRSLFSKISTMFKNIRYLYKMLGTTDISQYSDGTVTGAIKAACDKADANEAAIANVNSNLTKIAKQNDANLLITYNANIIELESGKTYGEGSSYRKIGTRVIIHLSIQQAITSGGNTIMTLPVGYRPAMVSTFTVSDGTETGIANVKITKLGLITAYTKSGYIIGEIEFEAYS